MATFAVLSNTNGLGGTVVRMREASAPDNAGWIDVTAVTPRPTVNWLYDGSVFSPPVVPIPTSRLILTDIQVSAVSILTDATTYELPQADSVDLFFDVLEPNTDDINPINDTYTLVFEGLLGSQCIPFDVTFVAGQGTQTIPWPVPGTYQLNSDSINFAVRNELDKLVDWATNYTFVINP